MLCLLRALQRAADRARIGNRSIEEVFCLDVDRSGNGLSVRAKRQADTSGLRLVHGGSYRAGCIEAIEQHGECLRRAELDINRSKKIVDIDETIVQRQETSESCQVDNLIELLVCGDADRSHLR